jgi:hypothetical protein
VAETCKKKRPRQARLRRDVEAATIESWVLGGATFSFGDAVAEEQRADPFAQLLFDHGPMWP